MQVEEKSDRMDLHHELVPIANNVIPPLTAITNAIVVANTSTLPHQQINQHHPSDSGKKR